MGLHGLCDFKGGISHNDIQIKLLQWHPMADATCEVTVPLEIMTSKGGYGWRRLMSVIPLLTDTEHQHSFKWELNQ